MAKLQIVWNRDKPRWEIEVKGYKVIRASEEECLRTVIASLEIGLKNTKEKIGKIEG